MWYGKAPGADRCGDVFRHANMHGVGRNGGVICAVGDDPQSKSSTLPSASEAALYDAGMPILVPGTPQEVLDLGRHGYEMSRFTGCWTGFKIVTAVADGFGSADVAVGRISPVRPVLAFDGQPWVHVQRPTFFLPDTVELEAELYERRHPAARAYAAENGLNAVETDPPDAWLTIVSAGRTYREVRQALADLGLASDQEVRDAGIRLVRLGMVYPLEPGIVRAAARGVGEILVVEEKRPFIERFLREQLYNLSERPRVTGKRDERDAPLIPVGGELSADRLRPILARRLQPRLATPRIAAAASPAPHPQQSAPSSPSSPSARPAPPRSAAAARTTGPPSRARARRSAAAWAATPWSCGWTAARSPTARWAARAPSGSAARRSPTCRTSCRTWATARSSTPAAWPCARRCPPGRP